MKIRSILAAALLLCVITQTTMPYAIYFNSTIAEVPAVNIYVFKNQSGFNDYLKRKGLDNTLVVGADKIVGVTEQGSALLSGYEKKKADIFTKQTGLEEVYSSTTTLGQDIESAANIARLSVEVAKILKDAVRETSWYDELLRWKVIDATHKDIKPGNNGRGAEWNWADIKKEIGVEQGAPLYIVITDLEGHILYQGTILSNEGFRFSVAKDADGNIKAIKQ